MASGTPRRPGGKCAGAGAETHSRPGATRLAQVRALLDSGANTRLVNSRGLSALDMAQPAAAQLFRDHTPPPTKQHTSVEGQDAHAGAVTEAEYAGRTSQAELPGQRRFTREYAAS